MPRAIDYLTRATTLDPSYALAWAGLAKACHGGPLNADAPPLPAGSRARDAAMKAVRIDPQLSEAQEALGHSLWTFSWDWPAAERAMRQAVALDPLSVAGHMSLGHLLSQMGQHPEAGREMRLAREPRPAVRDESCVVVAGGVPSARLPIGRGVTRTRPSRSIPSSGSDTSCSGRRTKAKAGPLKR